MGRHMHGSIFPIFPVHRVTADRKSRSLKPGFHSNARNARKVLRKKIRKQNKKCAINAINARKLRKQKYCVRFFTQRTQAPANRNGRSKQPIIEAANQALAFFVYTSHASHATHAAQALALRVMCALRAFEWKPGFTLMGSCNSNNVYYLRN